MSDPLEEIQKIVLGDIRRIYNDVVVDHVINPRAAGSLPEPDGFASHHSECGESMEIWLKVKDNHIDEVSFWTDGCAATIACGSMVSGLAKGRTVLEALTVSPQDIVDAFGSLPEGNYHCAELAADTLKSAVRDYLALQREPWKKAYRNQ